MKENTFKLQLEQLQPEIDNFYSHIETKWDKMRAENVSYFIANWDKLGDGVVGIIREVIKKRHNSRSVSKSTAARADISAGWNNGKGWKSVEVKSNRGRIGYLFHQQANGTLSNNYTVYSMCIEKYRNKAQLAKGKAAELMIIKPIIIRNDLFLQVILESNAFKMTDGEQQLQASNKLYKRLIDYPIPFDVDTVYSADDFEGIEI